ncbi:MAG: hypothetical protein JWN70_3875 [Planctomycetaceae bacterium]|nr:hypothetical protein [Planctomycetaceae bacterium]
MTESGPRKSLWELMGQKSPEEDPASTSEPSSSAPSVSPAPDPAADPDAEPPAANPSKGKSLWALMHHSEEAETAERPGVEAPVKPIDRRLRQLVDAEPEVEIVDEPADRVPAKRVDKRLRQMEELEVEIVDEPTDDDIETPHKKIDKRLRQLGEPEVEIVDEPADEYEPTDDDIDHGAREPEPRPRSKIRGIPSPIGAKPAETLPDEIIAAIPVESRPRFSFARVGRSRTALWSVILGALSLPISLIAIYPAIWSRIPASVFGFGALLLGFLAQGELQRAGHRGRELILAYVGMAAGLLAMFSGPLIYSPLDIYGQWSNSYTGDHLKQISMATEAYAQLHHSYPSGGLFKEIPGSPELEPRHGWMTLLLPHLPDGQVVSKQIDLSKAYSDPANLPAMSQSIPAFLAAGGPMALIQGKYGPAHFAGVGGLLSQPDGSVAHAGVFDVNSETNREDIIDGMSNTMIAGEVSISYPAWGEPHNWRLIGKGLNRDQQGFGNSRHTGAMFLMADGSVRFIPNKTDPKVLDALSTRDGEDQP